MQRNPQLPVKSHKYACAHGKLNILFIDFVLQNKQCCNRINKWITDIPKEWLTNDYKLLNHYTTLLGDFRKETTGIYEITPNLIFYFNK